MHEHALLRERERDPARPDPEFERMSSAGELDKEIDDRIDDGRVEHLVGGLVVGRGNGRIEIAVVVHRQNLRHVGANS